MKQTPWLVLGAVVVLLIAGALALILARGGVSGWSLARFGLPFGTTRAPISAPPASVAPLAPPEPTSLPKQDVTASAPAIAPTMDSRSAAPRLARRHVDRNSAAYVCAHGDPTDSRTIAACDRKDWAATERATR